MSQSVIATQSTRHRTASQGNVAGAGPVSSTEQHQGTGFFRGLMIAVPLAAGFWAALYIVVRALI